jgi:hypothetical protein
MMDEKLKALLEYVKTDGRVCPMPASWERLWEMLPDKSHIGRGWDPPVPLNLTVWWETPLLAKTLRLEKHIRFAAEHGALDKIDFFLRGLKPEEWFYGK